MRFIERETRNVILKFREIFLGRETVLSTHGIKSDENPFFCQVYAMFWEKMVHVVIDRYFSLFLKGLKNLFNPRLLLTFVLQVFFSLLFSD